MTSPCDSKDEIRDISVEQNKQGKDLAVVKDSTDRLRMEQAAFISESREVIGLLKEMAVEGKSQQRAAKEAQNTLFQKSRENAAAIASLQVWKIEHDARTRGITQDVVAEMIRPMKDNMKVLLDDRTLGKGKWLLLKDAKVLLSTGSAVVAVITVLWDHIVEFFTL